MPVNKMTYNSPLLPSYPHPLQTDAPPAAHVQIRRKLARAAAHYVRGRVRVAGSDAPQRILLIRPDHLGDLLFQSPALHWLRQQRPDAHLTLVIGPWGRPAQPALAGSYDELLEIPFPAFERGERQGALARWSMLPRLARRLRPENFDAAIIFRPDHWWGAMLSAMADIPVRLGYDTPETTSWLTEALPLQHEHSVSSNLRLVGALLDQQLSFDPAAHPLRFDLDPTGMAETRAYLSSLAGDQTRPLVIIHPGAGAAIKLWEPDKWGDVARRLSQEGCTVAISGGPDEVDLTAAVSAASGGRALDLGGRTSFAELAALLAAADLVLGPDSGPLNLAVAVGTPTIHLFGPADPVRFGPWGDAKQHLVLQSDWTCVPCGRFDWPDLPEHGCVRDISVDAVLTAAQQLLKT